MAENSNIEWTDHTFNPWIGCTKVGPGCDHCYAETLSTARLGVAWGAGAPRRRTAASTWNTPRRWDRRAAAAGIRQRVFCASLADVFDNEVDPAWRADLFALIRETPNLDWLLVTKRIGNAEKMATAAGGWPSNVWLGATIVNQAEADRDIAKLLEIEGPRFRFLSMEPLLGPVDLRHVQAPRYCAADHDLDWKFDALSAGDTYEFRDSLDFWESGDGPLRDRRIDWVIVGGESGAEARPLHFTWVRSLRDQCAVAGVPFLFKQWGEWAPICSMSEELADSLYHPAPARDPERSRRCKVGQLVMHNDGEIFMRGLKPPPHGDGSRLAFQQGYDAMTMFAVGKTRAGRLLDGVTHDGVPA